MKLEAHRQAYRPQPGLWVFQHKYNRRWLKKKKKTGKRCDNLTKITLRNGKCEEGGQEWKTVDTLIQIKERRIGQADIS